MYCSLTLNYFMLTAVSKLNFSLFGHTLHHGLIFYLWGWGTSSSSTQKTRFVKNTTDMLLVSGSYAGGLQRTYQIPADSYHC